MAQKLPSYQGNIYKVAKKGNTLKMKYGVIRNKKFKYYRDYTMKQMDGVIDFDRVQCVIMIESGEEEEEEPCRFRIECIGIRKQFVFQAEQASLLREWTQTLYGNWHASKSFTITN